MAIIVSHTPISQDPSTEKGLSTLSVAKYIIAFYDCKGDFISNKKLQKILYYIQAWNYTIFDDPIFYEEPEAWRHGPVYPTVYHEFKKYGYHPLAIDDDYNAKGMTCQEYASAFADKFLSVKQVDLMNEIFLKYGDLPPFSLEVLTHREKPWIDQRDGLGDFDSGNKKISLESMKMYYGSLRKA